MKKFSICKCLYSKNIFLKRLDIHVEYNNRTDFLKNYTQVLTRYDVQTDEDREEIIAEIEREVARRCGLSKASQERRLLIGKQYKRKHPDLFQLKENFLAPEFLQLVDYCNRPDSEFEAMFTESPIKETNISRAYTVPVFTEEFCQRFLEEIQNFEDSECPKGRPNTMNNYGVLLDELGFNDFISELRDKYLCQISKILFPDWGGSLLDSHKAFIVQYKIGEDLDLGYHYDNAEVTLNVSLSPKESYSGGKLYFGGMRAESNNNFKGHVEFEHQPTIGLIHRGQQKHGAMPISRGARYNLIIWMRASSVRNRKCPMCDLVPDLEETVGFGGGFTQEKPTTVDVCSIT